MTAVGFVLLAIAFALIVMDEHYLYPEWLELLGGYCILGGFVLVSAGVATWLWKVMP